jgi:hypothetical protein
VGAFLASYHLAQDWQATVARPACMPSELTGRVDFHYRASLLRIACLASLRPARRHLAGALLDEVRASATSVAAAV